MGARWPWPCKGRRGRRSMRGMPQKGARHRDALGDPAVLTRSSDSVHPVDLLLSDRVTSRSCEKKTTCRARVRPTIPLPLTTSESAAIPAPQASRWSAAVVRVVRSTQRMLQISSGVSLWEVCYRVACARIPTAYGPGDGIALELAQKRMTTSPRLEASQNPQSVVATQVVGSSGARRAKLTRFTFGNFPQSHVAVSRACSSSTLIDLIPRQTRSFDSLIVSSFLAHSAHSLARR